MQTYLRGGIIKKGGFEHHKNNFLDLLRYIVVAEALERMPE